MEGQQVETEPKAPDCTNNCKVWLFVHVCDT